MMQRHYTLALMEVRNEITAYLENISLILLGILLLTFPLILTPLTTDLFVLPKQIILGVVVVALLLFFGAKMISDGAVRLRRTPFDLPVLLFCVVSFVSGLFAVNRADSLIAFVPLFLTILSYFLIVNVAKSRSSLFFLLSCLVIGASLTSALALLSFFKIYLLPFAFTKIQSFSPLGSLLDQAMYLVLVLPIALYFARPFVDFIISMLSGKSIFDKPEENQELAQTTILKVSAFAIAVVLIGLAIGITLYQLLVVRPSGGLLILPFEIGFQTAFAAISQDVGRVAQGFFFGSGFGTYITDFARFKQATFNLNQTLWSLTFFRSASFVLEILATIGVLGLGSFLFLVFKVLGSSTFRKTKNIRENPVVFSVIFAIIVAFLLPLSPLLVTLFFFIIGLFTAAEGLRDHHNFFDVELHFVAFKKGFIPVVASPVATHERVTTEDKSFTKLLPVSFFIIFVLLSLLLGFFSYRYVASDLLFQDSLIAAAANNGLKTYNDQTNAINVFPYRDAYYRIYSQTNLAIANSLAAQQPRNASPSAQTQQTIYALIQQSINGARNATIISPLTSLNWQNLASIYRALIGFGQNAENFSIASMQQAIALDPNNPQGYLNLGGIYYQLAQWDLAQRQFQVAINLKPDFANAYYNLGHALENKGDLQNALVAYQTVRTLVSNDPNDLKRITEEIAALEKKLGGETSKKSETPTASSVNQPPLNISTPSAQLPEREPQVQIPPPATPSAR